jgi:hypothetical protein
VAGRATAIVRTRVDRQLAARSMGNALDEIDASIPFQLETMESRAGQFQTRARLQTTICAYRAQPRVVVSNTARVYAAALTLLGNIAVLAAWLPAAGCPTP